MEAKTSTSKMENPRTQPTDPSCSSGPPKRLRLACDSCHGAKIRCTGGQPCKKCQNSNLSCNYSYMARLGKPKGSRNKKTLERLSQSAAAANGEASTSGAVNRNRSKSVESRGHGSPFELSAPVLPATTTWPAFTPTYPSLSEEMDLCMDTSSLHNLLDWDASMPPPTSPDGALLPIQLITPPLDKDMPSTMSEFYNGYYNYLSPSSSDTANTCSIEGDRTESEWRFRPSAMSQVAAALGEVPSHAPTQDAISISTSTDIFDAAFLPDLHHDFEDKGGTEAPGCRCLRMLADQSCQLSSVERRQESFRIDTIFSKTSVILDCSSVALACPLCVRDSKVLLLVMTLLQTVFNWARVSFQRDAQPQRLPAISFGDWEVSEEEGSAIRALLGSRVLTKSASMVDILHRRVTDIADTYGKHSTSYQVMDAEVLQTTLQRLTHTFREVSQLAKAVGYDC